MEEKEMPSKVGIIKDMRQAFAAEKNDGKDPGPKVGEQLFEARVAEFEKIRTEQGAEAAVASDELLGLYFANLWVGEAFRPQGPEVRAAVKKFRVMKAAEVAEQTQSVTDAVASAPGVELVAAPKTDESPVTEQERSADQVYQATLDQIGATVAERTEVAPILDAMAGAVEAQQEADAEVGNEDQTPLTEAQVAEQADMENAYAVAEVIEAGQSVAPRKLDMEALRHELRMVDLFIGSVESNHEAPSRKVSRRRRDLVKAIANRAV